MNNSIFGEMAFNLGFDTKLEISIFSRSQNVLVTAEAFRESDGVTDSQEKTFVEFKKKKNEYLVKLENLLLAKYGVEAKERFSVTQILISRDGKLAVLFDDSEDEDEGIAVQLIPTYFIEIQSNYL
ncbi:hypothetical protein ACVRXQ_00755 [Streptococcus panodentis]|uniref:Uncharacterized protein n=1 Tax=Streptococcus panodentis TaxID=1581472 RepID=A0ABS5AVW4_9STRE|nr:hypothetical protein [Streptococcus panodentis]MBP2619879.1 hypothetical protein [Streptococcus panodentis]